MGRRKRNSETVKKSASIAYALKQLEAELQAEEAALDGLRSLPNCFYYQQDEPIAPLYNPLTDYFSEFWRVFVLNEVMVPQLEQLAGEVRTLQQGIQRIELLQERQQQLQKETQKKKHRRLATEIAKEYPCPYPNCFKQYGTDVSLNLHIKIKHDGGNKTQRQAVAKHVITAMQRNLPPPVTKIVFPPGYLDQLRAKFTRHLA